MRGLAGRHGSLFNALEHEMPYRPIFMFATALAVGLAACEGPSSGIPAGERGGIGEPAHSEPLQLPAQRAETPTDEILVFFTSEERPRAVTREVPHGDDLLRAALLELLEGPTRGEQAEGLDSFFSPSTAGMLSDVTLDDTGHAVVDFEDFSRIIPNASTSAGSFIVLGELNATVFQFPEVRSVQYRFRGDCDAFWNWLQRGCQTVTRADL